MTCVCPACEFAADIHLLKLQRLQNKVLRSIANFPRRTPIRDLHMAFKRNYAGNKQKSYKIMKMQMFATLDNERNDTGNIRVRGLNLAAVEQTAVQVTRLPLYQELVRTGHDLLY
jgi:hypothetical protein